MFEDYDKRRHSVTKLCVHLVFTTKYRRKVMTPEILEEMKISLSLAAQKIGCQTVEINGEADHIHLLLLFPPTLSISSLVNTLKAVSSRMIRARSARRKDRAVLVPLLFRCDCRWSHT